MHALKIRLIFSGYFCCQSNMRGAAEAVQTMSQDSACIAAFGKKR
jgi:hypothetical protein